MPPPISVLMPAHNASLHITEAIQSILDQTYDQFELLIINDASTDDTVAKITAFHDPRIRFVENKERLGLIQSLNKGIGLAQGRYIARLDADDIALPNRLKDQLDVLESDPTVGLVSCQTEVIDEHGHSLGFSRWHFSPEALFYMLHFRNCLTHSSVIFRKELIIKLGNYAEAAVTVEDFDLWHRISMTAKLIQLPRPLVKWRQHSKSVSQQTAHTMQEKATALCQSYIKELTNILYPLDVVSLLIRPIELKDASQKLRTEAAQLHPIVLQAILKSAPSYYDHSVLHHYASIEQSKYAAIFQSLGVSYTKSILSISWSAQLIGQLNYLVRYRGLAPFALLISKDHF